MNRPRTNVAAAAAAAPRRPNNTASVPALPAPVAVDSASHLDILRAYSEDNSMDMFCDIVKIPPHHYIHALNRNSNVTRVVEGPYRFTCLDDERVVFGPEKCLIIPPNHYAIIENPVLRDADGRVALDRNGQARLRHAEREVRLESEPFPLYPGEVLASSVMPLTVVPRDSALRLQCLRDFDDKSTLDAAGRPTPRKAGDIYLVEGPCTYAPQVESQILETIKALVLQPDQALRLAAIRATIDRDGHARTAGEEWLVRRSDGGAYLLGAYETLVCVCEPHVLTPTNALHFRANAAFIDRFGRARKPGQEWLVTLADGAPTIISDVHETLVEVKNLIALSSRDYAVIVNPVGEDGLPRLGTQKLIRGPATFFLQPGESMASALPQQIEVLSPRDALLVRARENFVDAGGRSRSAGQEWLVTGPCEFVPPLPVQIVRRKHAVLSIEAFNVYVFDLVPYILIAMLFLLLLFFMRFGLFRASSSGPAAKEL